MTFQTDAPLVHRSMSASNRGAREIARLAHEGDLDLTPPYQRASVWGEAQRIGLVKSWATGVPIPAIIVNTRGDSAAWQEINGPLGVDESYYVVVDGKQRVETAVAWFFGDLAVPASWFDDESVVETVETEDGPYVRFSGLTAVTKRHFVNRAMLPVIEAHAGSIAEEADLYLLVNGAGTPQTEADMDNAASYSTQM